MPQINPLTEGNLKSIYSVVGTAKAANGPGDGASIMSKQERHELLSNYFSEKKVMGQPVKQKKVPIMKPLNTQKLA